MQLIDGTGASPQPDQTRRHPGRADRRGRPAARRAAFPAGARTMDLTGHTVIPGLVGMHDHLFYTAAGGRAVQISYTGPRLYLGSGVTTIRTTGSRAPYAEINLKATSRGAGCRDRGFISPRPISPARRAAAAWMW